MGTAPELSEHPFVLDNIGDYFKYLSFLFTTEILIYSEIRVFFTNNLKNGTHNCCDSADTLSELSGGIPDPCIQGNWGNTGNSPVDLK